MNIREHLQSIGTDTKLMYVLLDVAHACEEVYHAITISGMQKNGAANASGDVQSPLDITARDIFSDTLHANRYVRSFFNEEHEEVVDSNATDNLFVAFDPYDGGSVGDADITIGSIIGIWNKPPQMGQPIGTHLISAAYGLYGPKCLFVCVVAGAVHWYEYDSRQFLYGGQFQCESTPSTPGIFCPGNIGLIRESTPYRRLFDRFLERNMALRYAACFAADIHHVLIKSGVYLYPRSAKKPYGHLRLLYEVAPFGYIVEAAGGIAIGHDGARVLDTVLTEYHQHSPIFIASPRHADLQSDFITFE